MNSAQSESVLVGETVFEITVLSGTQRISNFNGMMTITVPYTGEAPNAAWYLDDSGERERIQSSTDEREETITLVLPHLSLYIIGREEALIMPIDEAPEAIEQPTAADIPPLPQHDASDGLPQNVAPAETADGEGMGLLIALIIAGALAVAAVVATVLVVKKKKAQDLSSGDFQSPAVTPAP
jgi:hypothetical protein